MEEVAMIDRVYYVDTYDPKKARWILIASCATKREAISSVKTIPHVMTRVRRVESKVIYEVDKVK
jgi:hypothetical protein